MERLCPKTPKAKQGNKAAKLSERVAGGKDHASSAYDEYLWLLQQRNRLLKKLKAKDEQQVELEKKEQGFSLYINGANREIGNQPMSRRTKTADEHSSSRGFLEKELGLDNERNEARAKTAPTKLTRKEWKPTCIKIKTEEGDKIAVKVPGKLTGIYSEDFDGMDDSESEEEEVESINSDNDLGVEQLSLSFNDVHKLRRSLEMDSSIRESIQTAVKGDGFIGSGEDCGSSDDVCDAKQPSKCEEDMDIKDIEDVDDEEIEEELEMGNESVDTSDSKAFENIHHLGSNHLISENLGGRKERSDMVKLSHQTKTNEDTIVLTFSSNKPQKRQLSATRRNPVLVTEPATEQLNDRQFEKLTKTTKNQTRLPKDGVFRETINLQDTTKQLPDLQSVDLRGIRPLSATCRKKTESSYVVSSQEVLEAMALENEEVEKFRESSGQGLPAQEDSRPQVTSRSGDRPSSVPTDRSLTEETLTMVTKKVRSMNASQQKQLLDLLGKLDPMKSQDPATSPFQISRSVALASPESSPPQPSSPQTTKMPENMKYSQTENNLLEVYFEIKSNWGHAGEVGLTEIQFFDCNGSLIEIPRHHIQIMDGISNETSLENLVNGKMKTTNERYMWKCPFVQEDRIELMFQVPCLWTDGNHDVSRIKVWNYNKKMKDLNVGVKDMRIFIGGELVWDGVVDKGCGNQIYDYAEVIYLKSKQDEKTTKDTESTDRDPVIRTETITLRRSENEILHDSCEKEIPVVSFSYELKSTDAFTSSSPQVEDIHERQLPEDTAIAKKSGVELPSKPVWLEEMEAKKSSRSLPHGQAAHPHLTPKWLDEQNDERKDSHVFNTEKLDLLDQPKSRSRPSGGRRSNKLRTPEGSNKRNSPRSESGRRSANVADNQQEPVELHQRLTKLCFGNLSAEENPAEQERLLEESLNSLSQFKRCHQGRITPSNKMEMDFQGDVLDDFLTPAQPTSSEQMIDMETTSSTDDFVIPELPTGQRLVINILSTWGDQYYVGLNGVEIFNDSGKPVQISKITADPPDINILPKYKKDPRVVSNLIDGVYCTRDDMHLWMAPFTAGKDHLICIDFKDVSTLAMVRIWNYNKSRIHSFRGARDIQIFLDNNLIFRGEMARASGELGSSETFGDTILFTMNEDILEAMAANDQTYEPDLDEDEDYLQTSNSFKRPVTADKGAETEQLERPFTCPKERKRPTREPTYPNKIIDEMNYWVSDVDGDFCVRRYFGQVVELNFLATWGDMYYLGLTGLQLLGADDQVIDLTFDMLQACPKDLNDLPEYEDDDRTLDKLIDGENVTMNDEHMWLIPFMPGGNHLLTITLKEPMEITGLRLWNYNKSSEGTYRGVKRVLVKLDGKVVASRKGFLIRKGPGNCHFDFVQDISFLKPPKQPWIRKPIAADGRTGGDCDLTVKPCGLFIFRNNVVSNLGYVVFQFQLFSSWGDPYYLGLNGFQFFNEDGQLIQLKEKNVTAYPESVNVLEGVKDDVRTPEKLIDGVNDTDDGRHMWLTPIFPGLTNSLYVVFDEPTTISMVKLWNYRKTPIRGVQQFSILVDDLLVFNGILPQVPTVTRGILPNMDIPVPHSTVLFTDDTSIRNKENSYALNPGGYFENEEVCLMHEKSDFQQKKQTSNDIDQALRPKTSVTNLSRAKR